MKLRTKIAIVLAVVFVALIVWAAGPPPGTYIVPSFFTTNAAKIFGTGGIVASSNATLGTYTIDGSGIVGGSGATNIFNPNQFTQIGVGGTNVNIKDGVLVTNQNAFSITNEGRYNGHGGFTNFGSFDFRTLGGTPLMNEDSADVSFTADIVYLPILSTHTLPFFKSGKILSYIPNGRGAFTNGNLGTDDVGYFDRFLAATNDTLTFATIPGGGSDYFTISHDGANGVKFFGSDAGGQILNLGSSGNINFGPFGFISANTVLYVEGSKNLRSVASGSGYLRSDGAGTFSWDIPTNGLTFDTTQFARTGVGGTNIVIKDGVILTNLLDYGTATFVGTLQDSTATTWNILASGAANFGSSAFGINNVGDLSIGSGPLFQVTAANGNIGIIKGLGGYIWPSAHAAGYLRNDAGGGLSWDIPTNSLTFDTTQFARTGAGGTNIALKSGFQGTNAALFGVNTNNGSMNTAGGVTNYSTTRNVGAVENQSTVTNSSWQNTAGGVTNYSTVRNVGAVEHQSTTTNTSWINNGGVITNYPPSTTTIPQWTALAGGHNADAFAILQGPSKVGGFDSNGAAFLIVSNATTVYPASYRVFTQTIDSQATNITTVSTTWLGTGVGSLTLPAGFWQVGREVGIKIKGSKWTPASAGSTKIQLKLGATVIATNVVQTSTSSLVDSPFSLDLVLTCRTNSATGWIMTQGEFMSTSTSEGTTWVAQQMRFTYTALDTTAAMAIDLVSTNGNATQSYMVKQCVVTVNP